RGREPRRDQPRDVDRRRQPRPRGRRARTGGGAALTGPVHRGHGITPDAGGSSGGASGVGIRVAGTRSDLGSGRARSGRGGARGDRIVDPGRGRGRAPRAGRRTGGGAAGGVGVIGGLVLAGGAGTRFGGGSKLVAELEGRPLLEHAVRAPCAVPEI